MTTKFYEGMQISKGQKILSRHSKQKNLTTDQRQDILISKSESFQIMKSHKATVLGKLKEGGLKLTSQRLAIIEVLMENTSLHPGASLIYQKAKKKVKGLSLSTVYYTLNELSKHGIIKMLEFDKMENRYEGNISHHLNLVCLGCGSILDYPKALPISSKKVESQMGFRPYEMRFEYYGYCKQCLQREK